MLVKAYVADVGAARFDIIRVQWKGRSLDDIDVVPSLLDKPEHCTVEDLLELVDIRLVDHHARFELGKRRHPVPIRLERIGEGIGQKRHWHQTRQYE